MFSLLFGAASQSQQPASQMSEKSEKRMKIKRKKSEMGARPSQASNQPASHEPAGQMAEKAKKKRK